ncbi:iron complex transport system substrate-binding protein [Mameliella alba]|uniref:ABC transporter substrate-binding protein n=1 Tax=Mameliella alba TaxID=561184 RepID=UPI00088CAE3E|nr:ABC transporter substrate-binding protein [Mameliella alba]OWV43136.1 ABC transporter substrate-binding protein [Mameliella alba]PTR35972.1 iron complex transport system substrate-binding protein [Mameliella alba]GGF81881.1 ABC transporter substrate-binding protein [Mameliella alba]SDE05539.1 iron complex transport system substrate-binding protein [Mameliella alba]
MTLRSLLGASALSLIAASLVQADPITLTDIAGREVTVDGPVDRVILGEGRQIFFAAVLDPENPFERVVGWRDDFRQASPESYEIYAETFPALTEIPVFGGFKDGTFDIEQAVSLNPDVMIMNLEAKAATDEAGYEDKLAKVGIPIVYVDFREKPFENTAKSMQIIGKLYGEDAKAAEFNDFYQAQIARVTDVIEAQTDLDRPLVFVERAGGYSEDCCMSFGDGNFGRFVALAGGTNLGSEFIPGTFGTVNAEQVIASDPDQIVVTGGNWEAYVPGGDWVGMGPGSDVEEAGRKLAALMERPAFTGAKAVETGQVHGIWHQFYNSPYSFVAVQRLATWLHPELFPDMNPEATLQELHERFLPVDYRPGYWVSLQAAETN